MEYLADAKGQSMDRLTDEGAAPASQEQPEKRRKTGGRRKKRRGAPLGNQNARKHGYYSKLLTPEQIRRLPRARATDGFDEEVALMRLMMGTLMGQSDRNFTLLVRAMGTFSRMISNTNRIRSSLKRIGIDSSL